MEHKFITTLFLTIFWGSLLIAGEDESAFCNTQPPGLTGYNKSCSISSQCVTGKCKNSKCVCDYGTTFSTCAVACVPDCNSTVTDTTGTITSPSYPQSFAAYCTWSIQGLMGTVISFDLKYMNTSTVINCSSDYLQIFDGPSTSPRLFDKMCTTWQPLTVSTGNYMHIVFRTTGSLQFIATFNIYERHCELYKSGKLASPGYPLRYLNNQEYTWTLSTRAESHLILNISFVETGDYGGHYITVYDGATKNAPSSKKVCSICGLGVSEVIVSTTNKLLVTFETGNSETYRGFYGEFYSQADRNFRNIILNESQGNISSTGYPFGNLDNMIYTWTIQGKAKSYIILNISDFELRYNRDNFIRIYDGPTTFSPIFGSLPVKPGLMVSTGNSMFIVSKLKDPKKGFNGTYEIRGRHSTLYESGKLPSPGYPLKFLKYEEVTWSLSTRADKRLILNLSLVEMDICGSEYITVYDGATKNAPISKNVCGKGVSDVILSTTNNLLVTFESYFRHEGFYGEFYSHDGKIRNIILNESRGNISSTGYLFGNLDNVIYTWTIQGKADSYILLSISDFELRDNSQNDFLSIYDGPTTFSPTFGSLRVKPALMVSTGNSMFILLKDPTQSFNGTYEIRGRHSTLYEVGKLANPGYPLRYLDNQEFTWSLSARADTRLILNLSLVEIVFFCDSVYITLYDGATKNAPSSKEICGNGVSDVIVSTSNNLLVTFKADNSGEYGGFYGEFYSHADDNIRNVILNESRGNISSPGYPFGKLDNLIYTWTIQCKPDSYILLSISDFQLRDNSQNDFLSIYDGPSTFSRTFGSLRVKPALMVSTGNSMLILLKDPTQGFNGTYEIRGNF